MKTPGLDRVSRRFLHLFPQRFRKRYGEDLAELYRDLYWTPGRFARPRFVARLAWDALSCGAAAHWDAWREPPPFKTRHHEGDTMSTFWKDVRLTLRSLARRPGFTAVVVLTLALGIGANTGLFSVVNAVLLRPLPYPEPERLVRLLGTRQGELSGTISYPNFVDWRAASTTLAAAAAYDEWLPSLTGEGRAERLEAARVTSGFFRVLGVEAAQGRLFVANEDIDGQDDVVVLTHGLWQRRFGADPDVVGRSVLLNARPHEVVGVLPMSFEDPLLSGRRRARPELFRPLGFEGLGEDQSPSRSGRSFTAIGRLAASVSLEQAQAELTTIGDRLAAAYPSENADRNVVLVPLHDDMVVDVRRSLMILLGAVAFVLAIAVANVVNLMLSRATDRRAEIALRAALGAGRGRLMRHFLTESLVLTAMGSLLGLWLAAVATRFLTALGGAGIPRAEAIPVDGRVLAFTALAAALAALVCGLVPAVLSTADLRSPLCTQDTGGRSRWRLKGTLVISEVALSLLLLTCAGLLLRSFWNLLRVDPGLDPEGVLTFQVAPPGVTYPDDTSVTAFYTELFERLGSLPGVEGLAGTSLLPLSGSYDGNAVSAEDQPPPPPGQWFSAQTRTVTPGYFRVMGMTVKRGRGFLPTDGAGAAQVTVISEAMAEHFWPGEEAVGKRLTAHGVSCEVVGVLADVKHMRLEDQAPPQVYIARDQAVAPWQTRRMIVVLRAAGDPLALLPSVRSEVRAIDADLPLANVRTMEQWVAGSTADPRFRTTLLAAFAGLALLLAAVGIYGVLSYAVTQSRREFAIRMALGAAQVAVLRHVIRRGLVLVGIGLALGLAAAFGVTRFIESLLFGVTATDPTAFVVVPLTLLAVAFLASYLPARRATRIDPMSTLRS